MANHRRGFKTEANKISRDIRNEMEIALTAPLDPWALAKHLEIPIIPLSDFHRDAPHAVSCFQGEEESAFSGLTVFRGSTRVIVHNDSHALTRQRSNLAHELAHALLFHEPHPALDEQGCRYWDGCIEDEAVFLSGALLVTEEAALDIVRDGLNYDAAAARFGVSTSMIRMRVNLTGARKRVHSTYKSF